MGISKFIIMRAKLLVLLSLGLILSIATSSCKSEMRSGQEVITELSGDYNILEVPFSVVNHDSPSPSLASLRGVSTEDGDYDSTTYGTDPLNENKIEKIDLFVITGGNVKGHYSSTGNSLVLDTTSKSAKAKVAKSLADQLEGKSVQIIMIANATESDFTSVTTYEQLKAAVQDDKGKLSPDPQTDGKVAPQEKFLMDGSLTATLTWGANTSINVGTLGLRRAASKIRVRVDKDINVVDLQNGVETKYAMVGMPAMKLVHYTEKGALIGGAPYQVKSGEWRDESAYREMPLRTFKGKSSSEYPKYNGDFYAAIPFYTYENDWSAVERQSLETYVMVRVKLRPVDQDGKPYYIDPQGKVVPEGTPGSVLDPGRDYYYRLPINYRKAMDGVPADKLNKLERNHLYDIYTTIGVLGSIDEGKPVDVTSNVAVQEWNMADRIDGTIEQTHFLVVKERTPLMPNTDTRKVGYISSTQVTTTITRAYYQYYDLRGVYHRVEFGASGYKTEYDISGNKVGGPSYTGKAWDGATVSHTTEYLENAVLTIKHDAPINYVPFYIELTVTQDMPGTLSEKVVVTQYPPRFVTGNESPGPAPTAGDPAPRADFRYHTTLGIYNYNAIDPKYDHRGRKVMEPQANNIFSRVTTVVPLPGEVIGVAIDNNGDTKKDAISNKMISPEFIIATQHGMSTDIPQYGSKSSVKYRIQSFAPNYGPFSYLFNNLFYPYNRSNNNGGWQPTVKTYTTAGDRCHDYFEGEYGTDGVYYEHYVTWYDRHRKHYNWNERAVHKKFKYQGRWRIPTAAELAMIDKLQKDPNSTVKGLMFGQKYWTAQSGMAYNFVAKDQPGRLEGGSNHAVRCIFDTFGLDDKGKHEVER